jgi:hypothetical protein
MTFPISRRNDRLLPPEWRGEVFICDIDRTYLATRFSSLKGLARIPFEFAIDKQDIDGMVVLLKELRRGPSDQSRSSPLYFISASPAQLRPVIQRKMLLDGLEFDGTTFKDWIGVIAELRLKRMREQLGFKLTALFAGRAELPAGAEEILIGDDLENDALAFTLYADLLAGRISRELLVPLLTRHGVGYDDALAIRDAAVQVGTGTGGVKRAYIRMERHSRPEAFLDAFPGLTGCHGALQMAVALWEVGSVGKSGVLRVTRDLYDRHWPPETIGDRLRDCCRRGLVALERAEDLRQELVVEGLVPRGLELPAVDRVWGVAAHREPGRPWTPLRHL